MAAAKLDLTLEQGATFRRKLTFKDANGTPIDLTGYQFRSQIKNRYDSAVAVAAFSFQTSDQTISPGEVIMSLSAVQTAAIPVEPSTGLTKRTTRYPYDLEIQNSSGEVARLFDGHVSVIPEVTR